jgi:hypothetical protein
MMKKTTDRIGHGLQEIEVGQAEPQRLDVTVHHRHGQADQPHEQGHE